MIHARELLSFDALSRYDDNGDPVYSTYERVLLALRWFGWCTADDLFGALDLDDPSQTWRERGAYSKAIQYWVKRGRVEQRGERELSEYRLIHPKQWHEQTVCTRCPTEVVDGRTMCQRHLDWEREYKVRRRAS